MSKAIKGLYLASSDTSEIFSVKDNLDEIADGSIPGIASKSFTREELDKLKQAMKDKEEKLKNKRNYANFAAACMAGAAWRTAEYAQSGRKFMRVSGLSGRLKAVLGKGMALKVCDNFEKK